MPMNEDISSLKGRVTSAMNDGRFEVTLDDGRILSCSLDKAMKRWSVVIAVEDIVTVEFQADHPERARIVFRHLHK